jgi:hypothetical protein
MSIAMNTSSPPRTRLESVMMKISSAKVRELRSARRACNAVRLRITIAGWMRNRAARYA